MQLFPESATYRYDFPMDALVTELGNRSKINDAFMDAFTE